RRQLQHPSLEHLARADGAALSRRQRRQLRASRSRREVLLRCGATQPADGTRDAYLVARHRPVEDERGAAVVRHVPALEARVVGKEKEGAVLQALEKDNPRSGPFLTISGKGHRVWMQSAGVLGLALPALRNVLRV